MLNELRAFQDGAPTSRMPVVFAGHGNPMNAITDTPYSRAWKQVGEALPAPAAIVCISAHWMTHGSYVTAMPKPRTIHDFGGFPRDLFEVVYPAPGSPEMAAEVAAAEPRIALDEEWGLDHGTWSVLVHMFPKADVPVLQVSLNGAIGPEAEYALLRNLRPLRERGVLFVGSGNIVHNLRTVRFQENAEPFDWAEEFDADVAGLLERGDHEGLIHYERLGEAARLSVPTDEHYRPMLAALALSDPDEHPRFFNEGTDLGSIGMRSFVMG
ncbi:MAG TPA: 4,5-DOPA dioxygenase extradiol [Armatimonadota bacterium]